MNRKNFFIFLKLACLSDLGIDLIDLYEVRERNGFHHKKHRLTADVPLKIITKNKY